jgi:hypothetical protein
MDIAKGILQVSVMKLPSKVDKLSTRMNRYLYRRTYSIIMMVKKEEMESDIHILELASGIKNSLIKSGLVTIRSILNSTTIDISEKLGIDSYVAQIILEEARRASAAMAVNPDVVANKYSNYVYSYSESFDEQEITA